MPDWTCAVCLCWNLQRKKKQRISLIFEVYSLRPEKFVALLASCQDIKLLLP